MGWPLTFTGLLMPSKRCLHLVVGLVALYAMGCGPVRSTAEISSAEAAVERARIAEAHTKAPYEYYSAKSYLRKAREEWGYSDFEAAKDYAAEAKRSADAALLKAKEDPYTGSPVPKDKLNDARLKKMQKRKAVEREVIKGVEQP